MANIKRIGVFTGGGDAPGLNAVIRAVTKKAIIKYGWKVLGIGQSTMGFLQPEKNVWLDYKSVSGILPKGGTILGTTNKGDPFNFPVEEDGKIVLKDVSQIIVDKIHEYKLDGIIAIGGDGTMRIAYKFYKMGIPIVGVPKTIDNDLLITDATFGFETAVNIVMEALDNLHSIAESRDRVVIVEVMGRDAGWIALHAGVAGGADVILIPEIPYHLKSVIRKIDERRGYGANFTVIIIAEGAVSAGGETSYLEEKAAGGMKRYGGAGALLKQNLERFIDSEVILTVLGHIQRGGTPCSYDRVLATRFGSAAADLMAEEKFGHIVCLKGTQISSAPMIDAASGQKFVPMDYDLLEAARSIGISLGD
ncbi:MAG: ATP-dependent 6-phosphofructokinase [Acidobacteria bacterium]|nr:ATP-dependent 6-phosphofructokinase [Acidobacteriota bacterium]